MRQARLLVACRTRRGVERPHLGQQDALRVPVQVQVEAEGVEHGALGLKDLRRREMEKERGGKDEWEGICIVPGSHEG